MRFFHPKKNTFAFPPPTKGHVFNGKQLSSPVLRSWAASWRGSDCGSHQAGKMCLWQSGHLRGGFCWTHMGCYACWGELGVALLWHFSIDIQKNQISTEFCIYIYFYISHFSGIHLKYIVFFRLYSLRKTITFCLRLSCGTKGSSRIGTTKGSDHNPAHVVDVRDEILPSYIGIVIGQYKDPVINQPV